MRNYYTFILLLVLFPVAFLFNSCTDKCDSTNTYWGWEPVTFSMSDVIDSIKTEAPIALENPGKIYFKDDYIYVNEVKRGVHVIDNSNPASPKNIAFIRIPGNYDIAIRNNTLYADSYIDLVALDISNPQNVTISKRVEKVFLNGGWSLTGFVYDQSNDKVITYQANKITTKGDCNNVPGIWFTDASFRSMSMDALASTNFVTPGNTSGKAGSMARFGLQSSYLYTVGFNTLQVFDVSNTENPTLQNTINANWGVETIWPYKKNLFLGTTTGMMIYNIENPAEPTFVSNYSHVASCDPVVVDDKYAYVTLRTGNTCARGVNQLEVIDLANLTSPSVVKTYPMDNPHGLGKENDVLFICDGDSGLKIYDAKDATKISDNLLKHYKNINAFDVIPLEGTLLMIGEDGLYQYDYSDLNNIHQVSKIPVVVKD
jgi:hypothetical protein